VRVIANLRKPRAISQTLSFSELLAAGLKGSLSKFLLVCEYLPTLIPSSLNLIRRKYLELLRCPREAGLPDLQLSL